MKFTTQDLTVIGLLAGLYIIFALVGSAVQSAAGVVGAAGIVMMFLGSFMLVLCCFLLGKFGAATTMMLIYTFVAIPLPVLGTPGFLPKIIIGFAAGLVADITYFLLRGREKIAAIVIGVFGQTILAAGMLFFGLLLVIPGFETQFKILTGPMVIPVFIIFAFSAALSGYAGYFTYNKIKNKSIFRKLKSGK